MFANVCVISLVACASSTRPPTAATGPRTSATPFQFNVVEPSPASTTFAPAVKSIELPNPPPETLDVDVPCCLVRLELHLQLEAAAHGADGNTNGRLEVCRVHHVDSRDLGQTLTDLVRVGDERPDSVRSGGNPLLAAVLELHGAPLPLRPRVADRAPDLVARERHVEMTDA